MLKTRRQILVACAAVLLGIPVVAAPQDRATASWWDRATEGWAGHYWIKTDLPRDEAMEIARHLNVLYEEYSRRLASLPPRATEVLNVLIFKDRRDYVHTLRMRFGIGAEGTGGRFFLSPSGNSLAFYTGGLPKRRIEHVAQHEGFHQFAWTRFSGDLPMWVNEGLAEFFGEAVVVGRSLIIGQSNPRVIEIVQDSIERDTYIPFRRMLTMTSAEWNRNIERGAAAAQYHQAWSMVHFLVYADPNGDGRPDYVDAFEHYLRAINGGHTSEQAWVDVFGPDIRAFEERWKEYARTASPSAFAAAMERIEFLAEGALELSRKGIQPKTLEELRDQMIADSFAVTIAGHSGRIQLRADDARAYEIPKDEQASEQPVFKLTEPDLNRLNRRERRLEAIAPTPPVIFTEHLEPRDLAIRWVRDPETHLFSYEIDVK